MDIYHSINMTSILQMYVKVSSLRMSIWGVILVHIYVPKHNQLEQLFHMLLAYMCQNLSTHKTAYICHIWHIFQEHILGMYVHMCHI